MSSRAGDLLVLLGPPATVAVFVPIVAGDDPEVFVPMLLALLILASVGIAIALILLADTTRGPATFGIVVWRDRPAFQVRTNFRRLCMFYGILDTALVLMALNGFRIGHVLPVLRLMSYGIVALTVLSLAVQATRLLRSGPLLLTGDGIAIDGGRSFVPWDALAVEPGADAMEWAVQHPDLVKGRRLRQLRPGDVVPLQVSLYFLARAIQFYAAHPEHRAAIGTAEELDRLRGALKVG